MHKNGAKWRRYTRVSVDKNPSSPPLPLDQNVKLRIIDKSSFSRQNFLIGHDKSRQDCRQYPRNGRIRDIRGYSILYHSPPLPLPPSLLPSTNLRGEPVSRVNLRRRGARGKLEKRIRDWRLARGGDVHIDAYFNDGWKDAILSRDKSIPFRIFLLSSSLLLLLHTSLFTRLATVNFAFHRASLICT